MAKMDEEDREFRITETAVRNAILALEPVFPDSGGQVSVAVLLNMASDIAMNHLGITREGFVDLARKASCREWRTEAI